MGESYGSHTYFEFGAILAGDHPHRGMVIKTFRTLGAAEEWVSNPPNGQKGEYVIRRRHVAKGDWSLVPNEGLPERTAIPGDRLPPLPDSAYPADAVELPGGDPS